MISKLIKIALVVILLLLIGLPWFVNHYWVQVAITSITYSMLALAFALSIKVGLPRFDIAAWWGVGAYTTALLMWKANMSFWPTIFIGGIIAVILGWLYFVIAIRRGMIIFLVFSMIASFAWYQIFGSIEFLGGWGGTPLVPQPSIGSFVFSRKPELYYLGLFLLGINIAVYYLLYNSKIGRAWNAIGSSLRMASSIGIDIVRYRIANVLIGNFFIAVAGSYYIAHSQAAMPSAFTFGQSIHIIVYTLLGGSLNILAGPIVGATVLTFVSEVLRVVEQYTPIIIAIITILFLIFVPFGIVGWIERNLKPWLLGRNNNHYQYEDD